MKKRRKSKWPIFLLMIIVLALTAFIVLRFVFVVRSVEISGDVGMPVEQVIRQAHVSFGESIFRVDEEEIRRSVNSMGNVSFEGIEKAWPDTLILSVRQRKAAAMALYGGKLLILDEDGCAMDILESAPNSDLIFASDFDIANYVIGEEVYADDRQLADFQAVVRAVQLHGAGGYVSELKIQNSSDLRIITRRGIEVRLGNRENMQDKIAWMKSAVADLENRGQNGGILDVSSGTKADYRPS